MDARAARPADKPHHPDAAFGALLFAAVFLIAFSAPPDPRAWIHRKTGELLHSGQALPRADPFSYGSAGAPWTTDSWLGDAALFELHRRGGERLSSAVLAAAAAAGFAALLPFNQGTPAAAAAVLALAAAVSSRGLAHLPAIFDLPLLALFLRLLRPRGSFRWREAAAGAALACAWANLHGPAAPLALWLAGLKAFKAGLRGSARDRLGYGAVFFACAAGFSLNPQGWGLLSRAFSDAAAAPAWPPAPLGIWTAFALSAAACGWLTLQQEFVATLTAASVLALSAVLPGLRPAAALAGAATVSLALGQALPSGKRRKAAAAWAAAALAAAAAGAWALGRPGPAAPSAAGAAEFLRRQAPEGRLFNPPELGEELIGLSGRKVFSDRRAGLYSKEFLAEASRWESLFSSLDAVYRFDDAVVPAPGCGADLGPLGREDAWRLVYADAGARVYAKRGGASDRLYRAADPRAAERAPCRPEAAMDKGGPP